MAKPLRVLARGQTLPVRLTERREMVANLGRSGRIAAIILFGQRRVALAFSSLLVGPKGCRKVGA
jgi:hypothetical protein